MGLFGQPFISVVFLQHCYFNNLVGADGNAPRALTSLPLGTVLQTAVGGNTLVT
jgi:hypothetical protein